MIPAILLGWMMHTMTNDGFAPIVRELRRRRDVRFLDLLETYTSDRGITAANGQEFYWPIDLHHNAAVMR